MPVLPGVAVPSVCKCSMNTRAAVPVSASNPSPTRSTTNARGVLPPPLELDADDELEEEDEPEEEEEDDELEAPPLPPAPPPELELLDVCPPHSPPSPPSLLLPTPGRVEPSAHADMASGERTNATKAMLAPVYER